MYRDHRWIFVWVIVFLFAAIGVAGLIHWASDGPQQVRSPASDLQELSQRMMFAHLRDLPSCEMDEEGSPSEQSVNEFFASLPKPAVERVRLYSGRENCLHTLARLEPQNFAKALDWPCELPKCLSELQTVRFFTVWHDAKECLSVDIDLDDFVLHRFIAATGAEQKPARDQVMSERLPSTCFAKPQANRQDHRSFCSEPSAAGFQGYRARIADRLWRWQQLSNKIKSDIATLNWAAHSSEQKLDIEAHRLFALIALDDEDWQEWQKLFVEFLAQSNRNRSWLPRFSRWVRGQSGQGERVDRLERALSLQQKLQDWGRGALCGDLILELGLFELDSQRQSH